MGFLYKHPVARAISSAVERLPYKQDVHSSILWSPIQSYQRFSGFWAGFKGWNFVCSSAGSLQGNRYISRLLSARSGRFLEFISGSTSGLCAAWLTWSCLLKIWIFGREIDQPPQCCPAFPSKGFVLLSALRHRASRHAYLRNVQLLLHQPVEGFWMGWFPQLSETFLLSCQPVFEPPRIAIR